MDLQMGPNIKVLDLAVTLSPNSTVTNPLGGDPVMCTGDIPGTATADKDTATGLTPVMVGDHIATFVVGGVKAGPANAAINAGDKVYMTSAGLLNGDTAGKF